MRKRDVFTEYGPLARAVLEGLLQKYQDQGTMNLDDPRVLSLSPCPTMGTHLELVRQFGTVEDFKQAVHELQSELYKKAA